MTVSNEKFEVLVGGRWPVRVARSNGGDVLGQRREENLPELINRFIHNRRQ